MQNRVAERRLTAAFERFFLLLVAVDVATSAHAAPPNVLLIAADDLGYSDV